MKSRTVLNVTPGGTLRGRLRVPGDKSISHRALMLGSIAEGMTSVHGFLEGDDTLATRAALQVMGVSIEASADGTLQIQGVGRQGLKPPAGPLELGNSGTAMRLLTGLLAGQSFAVELSGDASLCQRPMGRVIEPLSRMGARIECSEAGSAPLRIFGGQELTGIEYSMPVASAQIKSCLLLAGLNAQGRTCVAEPGPSRDHTERMLEGFGYALSRETGRVCLEGGGRLQGMQVEIPADLSSAAFFIVGATIAQGSEVVLESVGVNPTRSGILEILRLMGARIDVVNQRLLGTEPVADLTVRSAALHGIKIPEALVPSAIDEFPALFIAAACAEGETVLTGAQELRVKECDRIAVMAQGLMALGIEATPTDDGMAIEGGQITGGSVDSHGDHRVAMAFAIAGLKASAGVRIEDCANIDTSYPGFADDAAGLGLGISRT